MSLAREDPHSRRRLFDRGTPPALATLVLMAGVAAMSMNIFLPSMPGMAVSFDVDYAVMQLALSAYIGVMAVLQLVIGPLSDLYGRRPVILGCLAIFCVATAGCLLAPNIEVFMACRLLQASVSAGMVLSRAMVRDMVGPERAAAMIGYVTMGMAVVPMVAPAVGGELEQAFGWQANFGLLLICGLAVLALCWTDAGETHRSRAGSFGAQFRSYPELLASRRFWGYGMSCAFAAGSFFTFLGGAPYVATEVLGLSPSEMGRYFSFLAAGYLCGNFLSTRLSGRLGINRMIMHGGALTAASAAFSAALFLGGATHPMALFGPVFVVGVGNGIAMPNAMAGTLLVRPHLAGGAAGLASTLMLGGGSGLSALTGAMLGMGGGALPMLGMMCATGLASMLAVVYVIRVDRRRGPLERRLENQPPH